MTDSSTGQDVLRIRCYVVAVLVSILLVYVGISAYNAFKKRELNSVSNETMIPTWNGVPAMLEEAPKSARYEQGGKYLSNPSALKNDSGAQTAYAIRVITDFLRSLSPDQVDVLRKNPLRFNQLNQKQKSTLLLLTHLPGKADITKEGPVDKSHIFVSKFPSKFKQGNILFSWVIHKPGIKEQGYYYAFGKGVWMSITASGDNGFFQ